MNTITLHLDKSNAWRGLHFERDGKNVSIEDALSEGWVTLPNDTPAVATLLQNFVETRERDALQ